MSYRYRDDLTMADVAFEAQGRTLEEMFASAWDATLEVMIEDPSAIQVKLRKDIALEDQSLDLLLCNFLQELIYYKDAEGLLLRLESCRIDAEEEPIRLQAVSVGEPIDPQRHRMGTDVKAVTFHRFSLSKDTDFWRCTVVLDV
jgi:SHS2 domain-containing protein